MEVGYTGTQLGMTVQQKSLVRSLLEDIQPSAVAHGCCIGGDAEFHGICLQLELWIRIHPPVKTEKKAHCEEWNEMMRPKEYLTRNRDIVNSVGFLIACPYEEVEQLRSGTWSTARYAKKVGVAGFIILPDGGEIRLEDWEPRYG